MTSESVSEIPLPGFRRICLTSCSQSARPRRWEFRMRSRVWQLEHLSSVRLQPSWTSGGAWLRSGNSVGRPHAMSTALHNHAARLARDRATELAESVVLGAFRDPVTNKCDFDIGPGS